jgi:hypothetical protein
MRPSRGIACGEERPGPGGFEDRSHLPAPGGWEVRRGRAQVCTSWGLVDW